MRDQFLLKVGVLNPTDAIRNSLRASLQRNKTYNEKAPAKLRAEFRLTWAELIAQAAEPYEHPIGDDLQHCKTIKGIADSLTKQHSSILDNETLRFGTSQKAFNLYLKFLWRLGCIPRPPHCPVDRVILGVAGILGSWTACDSDQEYMSWIKKLREKAAGVNLGEWEYEQWMKNS